MAQPAPAREHPLLRQAPLNALIAGPWVVLCVRYYVRNDEDRLIGSDVAIIFWLMVFLSFAAFAAGTNIAAIRLAMTAKLRSRAKLALGWLALCGAAAILTAATA